MNPFPLQETQPLLPRDNSYQQTSTSASSRVEHEIIVDTNDDDIHYIPSNQSSLLSWFMPQFVSKDRLKSSILLVVTMMSMILLLGVSMSPSQIASEGSAEILHSSPQLKLSIHKEFVSQAVHKFKVFRTGDRSGQVIAQGVYEHSVTSWNQLDAQVTDVFSTVKDRDEMFDLYFQSMEAVGYLEGYVTCLDINHYYVNFYSGLFDGGDPTPETVNFLEENYEWMVNMAEREWKYSSYWLNVKALVAQLNGLVHGLQSGCPGSEPNLLPAYLPSLHKNPSLIHMLLLNANGDLYQIAAKFDQPDAGPSMADDDVYSYGYTPDFPDNFTAPIDLLSSSPYAAAEETNSKSDNYMHPSLQKLYYAQDLLRQAQQKKTKNGHIKKATSTTSASKRDLSSTKQASSKSEKKRDASKAKVSKETERKFSARPNRPGSHCSVLIKLTHDYSDLLYGHDTWDDFQCMGPRIFKRYYMPVLTYAGDNGTVPQPDMQVNGVSRSRVITQPEVSGVTVNQAAGGAVTQDFIDNKANEAIITVGQTKRAAVEHAASGSTSSSDGHSHSHTQSMDKKKDQKLPRVDITYMDMRFSSSPAYLTSMDDFFVLAGRANLAVMETSEDMIDETILEQITPGTLLSWARTRMANQLAVNGPHWADVFAVRHSGTYTNQWMVLDLDRFTPGKKPQPNSGLLTVLEELPGYIHWEDLTHILAVRNYDFVLLFYFIVPNDLDKSFYFILF